MMQHNKLEILHLTKRFGEKTLFEDLNLTVEEPAATMRITPSFVRNDSVFAMRAGSQWAASAASSTVALDTGNSITRSSAPN